MHRAAHPVLVTIRVEDDVGGLRKRHIWHAIRHAMLVAGRREDFRICHTSIQGNHIHLLVEATDKTALARGMQGFQISAAKRINRVISEVTGKPRRGRVFADRYHAVELTTPTQVRNALRYLFNNWRKHGEDRWTQRAWDPYSSAGNFDGWADTITERGSRLPVKPPETWLLATGWRRHGPLSPWEVPGERSSRATARSVDA